MHMCPSCTGVRSSIAMLEVRVNLYSLTKRNTWERGSVCKVCATNTKFSPWDPYVRRKLIPES